MTAIGIIFIALAAIALVVRRGAFVWVLAASAALPATAALTVGGLTITPFYLMAGIGAITLLFDRERIVRGPGRIALVVFTAWSIGITALGPLIFAGARVLTPRGSIDLEILSPSRLSFSISTLAQAGYLALAICVVVIIARRGASPLLPAVPLALGTLLSTSRSLAAIVGAPWPAELFDNSTSVIYSDTSLGAEARLRGVFNEPSELAGFSMAAAVYFIVLAARSTGARRYLAAAVAAAAVYNLNASSSGTALIAVAIIAAVGGCALVTRFFKHGGRGAGILSIGIITVTLAAIFFGDVIVERATGLFEGKVGSDSFDARTTSDLFSLELFLETGGLGVGLGGNRPSSFLTMLLSCVGVVGALAFAIFVVQLMRRARLHPSNSPVLWALLAILVSKSVSLPDLSTPVMWVLIGACASAAWSRRSDQTTGEVVLSRTPPPPAPVQPADPTRRSLRRQALDKQHQNI